MPLVQMFFMTAYLKNHFLTTSFVSLIPFLPAPSRIIQNCNLTEVENEISDKLFSFLLALS